MTSPSTLLLLGKKVPSVIELVGLLCIRTLLFFIYLFLVCLFVFFWFCCHFIILDHGR